MGKDHTPGPWRLQLFPGMKPAVQRGREGGFEVWGSSPEQEEADARLMAASPDLLEALQYARNLIGPDEVIDAAIRRATGEDA